MTELVAHYDDTPLPVKGNVEIIQTHRSGVIGARAVQGEVRCGLAYVRVDSEVGALLVPFGQYDDWSLRDRYNEAIRIMNTLGAATITCETFGESTVRRGLRARFRVKAGEIAQQRIKNSGFDFRHVGTGSAPRDPRPLRWPDEPGFSAAVASVLDNSATEVEINIRSNRAYSINGSLGLQLSKLGFDLGGGTEHSGATTLHIGATFQPTRRGWR